MNGGVVARVDGTAKTVLKTVLLGLIDAAVNGFERAAGRVGLPSPIVTRAGEVGCSPSR